VSGAWIVVVLVGVVTALFKAAGPVFIGGRRLPPRVQSAVELLAPVKLNIVCFRHRPPGVEGDELDVHNLAVADDVLSDARVFFGSTRYDDKVAFRPAIANWRTTERDVDLLADVVLELGARRASRARAG